MSKFVSYRVFIGMILLGYVMPWLWVSNHAVAFNAYDFAEWVSLFPSERGTAFLTGSLLLRFHVVLCLMLLMLGTTWQWRSVFLIIGMALLLPPAEILQTPNDPNFQQQFILAILAVILPIASALYLNRNRASYPIGVIGISVIGLGLALGGVFNGVSLAQSYNLFTTIGAGFLIVITGYMLLLGWAWKQKQNGVVTYPILLA